MHSALSGAFSNSLYAHTVVGVSPIEAALIRVDVGVDQMCNIVREFC